ncbi:MAG: hypothetical protein JXM73_16345 [Anaerolineae bacterium]|nr:hypothetical protein [Anaerolineae bacterium]
MNQSGGNTRLIVAAVGGLILGLLLGMLLFWGVVPPKMGNPQTYDLAEEGKIQYVKLAADSYALDKDLTRVQQFLSGWSPEEQQQAFSGATTSYEAEGRSDKIQKLNDLQLALGLTAIPGATATPEAEPQAAPSKGLLDRLKIPCLVFVFVLLVLVLAVIGLRLLRQRRAAAGFRPVTARPLPEAEAPLPEEWRGIGQPPLGHFITTYKLGEDTYDESFSIETPTGDFLGECGVGISELIGKGEPDSVTAFEVWLFDKSDIRTVTKVLMSEYAYNDEQMRARLAPKGEAVLAEVGVPFMLETTGLQVQATVSDLQYGEGQMPPKSFFRQLTLGLVAMAKPME